jgi:excisionase family DNA binding protein
MPTASELTPREAAVQLKVSLAYIYHLVWAKKLPAARTNGRWRIPADAVERRLKSKEAERGPASS